jgi:hypothetical protein
MSEPESLELGRVLEQMRAHGLIGRATHLRVGQIELVMLPAPQDAAESETRRERRAEEDIRDVLFGSA